MPSITGWLAALTFLGILLALVVAVIPLYTNVGARARLAKAQADTRAIESAIAMYRAHTGTIPVTIGDLTRQVTNARGQVGGPFFVSVPLAPSGGEPEYRYRPWADGRYALIWVARRGEPYAVFLEGR